MFRNTLQPYKAVFFKTLDVICETLRSEFKILKLCPRGFFGISRAMLRIKSGLLIKLNEDF